MTALLTALGLLVAVLTAGAQGPADSFKVYLVTAHDIVPGATGDFDLTIESSATTGFRLVRWCLTASAADTADAINVNVSRRIVASTGGVLGTSEGTASPAISKADPAAPDYGGIIRCGRCGGSTMPTAPTGARVDLVRGQFGEVGAGTADYPATQAYCVRYADPHALRVPAGTANGLAIRSLAAVGTTSASLTAIIIVD